MDILRIFTAVKGQISDEKWDLSFIMSKNHLNEVVLTSTMLNGFRSLNDIGL